VRAIEILLGLLLHSYQDAEDLVKAVLRGSISESRSTWCEDRGLPHHLPPRCDSLLMVWRQSAASEELQRALFAPETEDEDETYVDDLDRRLTNVANALGGSEMMSVDSEHLGPHALPQGNPLPLHAQLHLQPAMITTTYGNISGTRHEAVLAPDGSTFETSVPSSWPELVEIYMTQVHPWFPVLQKDQIYRSCSLLANAPGAPGRATLSRGDEASAWSVVACGACRRLQLQSDTAPTTRSILDKEVSLIFSKAKSLVLQDGPSYNVGHVHALLTLALTELFLNSAAEAWLLVGRAMYIAASLNLIPSVNNCPAPAFDDRNRRLALGCFVLDSLVSWSVGCRPYLCRQDLDAIGYGSPDGLEEWEIWRHPGHQGSSASTMLGPGRNLSTFNQLCYLSSIINQLCWINGKAYPRSDYTALLDELVRNQLSLEPSPAVPAGSLDIELRDRPHVMQVRIAAASILIRIATLMDIGDKTHLPPVEDLPPSLNDTFRLLQSTPKDAPIWRDASTTPFIASFLTLLHSSDVSSVEYYLRNDWPALLWRGCPIAGDERVSRDHMSHVSDHAAIPTNTHPNTHIHGQYQHTDDDSNQSSLPGSNEPIRGPCFSHGLATNEYTVQWHNGFSYGNDSDSVPVLEQSRQAPLPTPSISGQSLHNGEAPNTIGINNTQSLDAAESAMSTSLGAQGGLFDQLCHLDMTEWLVYKHIRAD
jgi:hypothetical protein